MALRKINKRRIKRVICSMDWGFRNAGVLQAWGVDGDGRMYLLHEIYKTKMLVEWWVNEAKTINQFYNVDYFVCDPSEPEHIKQLQNAGLTAIPANNDIVAGINAVKERMRIQEDGMPRIMFLIDANSDPDPDLENRKKPSSTIDEITGYVWDSSGEGVAYKERPVKVDDHGMDAMRYAVMSIDRTEQIDWESEIA